MIITLFKAVESHQKHDFLLTFGPITQKLRLKQKKVIEMIPP